MVRGKKERGKEGFPVCERYAADKHSDSIVACRGRYKTGEGRIQIREKEGRVIDWGYLCEMIRSGGVKRHFVRKIRMN